MTQASASQRHNEADPSAGTTGGGKGEVLSEWEPRIGAAVRDTATRRIGRVMDRVGGLYQLRPLKGGLEWDAHGGTLHPVTASDLLSAEVAVVNARSIGALPGAPQ
ncbi:hypothetical protein ACIQ9E_17305 [Streptomyces sp. NPDC094448]|uniref:hypothetical protein n=1 Tax=Streptomyces sp. NPDC094448 TaxID=3366063 RepID=UPI0037F92E72